MDWKKEHPQYSFATLEDSSTLSPWQLWVTWQEEAQAALTHTNEIALATCDLQGRVSVRMVLLKTATRTKGFCWFTNKSSEKGIQLASNPYAEILWFNSKQQRQVRIRGWVSELSRDEVLAYAHSRPLRSQISALVSQQSKPLESKKKLEEEFETVYQQYHNADTSTIPVSDEWTGYRLIPQRFEFWQGRVDRLHDRVCFTYSVDNADKTDGLWQKTRLYP